MTDAFQSPIAAWFVSGKNPKGYDAGEGHLRSRARGTAGFATIMSRLSTNAPPASAWLGKRVRLRADVGVADVTGWAGLWMRVDGAASSGPAPLLAFDNMQQRAVRGTVDSTLCEVILDIAADADSILFGLLLEGDGEAWVRSASIDVVDASTPVTEERGSTRGVILESNLEALLTTLAWVIGDDLDGEDWSVVRAAVAATDEADDHWHEVPAFAARSCRVAIARDARDDVLHAKVELPKRWRLREAGLAMEIFGFFAAKRALRQPRGEV